MNEEKETSPYAIPLAIIGAGLLIAGAIYFGGSREEAAPIANPATFDEALATFAEEQGIDADAFASCLADPAMTDRVAEDEAEAQLAGATGTPYSVIVTRAGERFVLSGALPYEQVKERIDSALSGAEGESEGHAVYTMRPAREDDHIRGSADAEVTIVEFSDFDCPFCQRFHPTLERAVEEYDGRVAWVYRHFPIEQLHPNAPALAVASECVAKLEGNDAFWEFAARYFALSQ